MNDTKNRSRIKGPAGATPRGKYAFGVLLFMPDYRYERKLQKHNVAFFDVHQINELCCERATHTLLPCRKPAALLRSQ